jgi:acetoacetate decarboxylase
MFKFEDNKCYRMPAHFGGAVFDPNQKAYYHNVVTIGYTYTTDGDQLADYLPEGFELTTPELMIQFQQCRQIDWMAGSYYNLIWVAAPVRFNGQRDRLEGNFALVVWENKTTPILTGNQMGIPKIYADIEDLHIVAETYRTRVSYEGSTFLQMEMTDPQPVDEQQVKSFPTDVNSFGWRYVPKMGGPGAELSQPTLFPMRCETDSAWTGRGTVQWTELTWEQNPMQCHIIKALAELPMIKMAPVTMMKGRMVLMDSRGRVLK